MVDRPIIFSAPMIRALLDGQKTQTRRLATSPLRKCVPGDRLWVRESAWLPPKHISPRDLRDGADTWASQYHADGLDEIDRKQYKAWNWKSHPSIHMPRWASRITLTVTDVRFQRLQKISEADARAEGADDDGPCDHHRQLCGDIGCCGPGHRGGFHMLWNSLHPALYSWEANPEIVALTFDVALSNIDRAETDGEA